MTAPVDEFRHWFGVWTGVGEGQDGTPVLVRNEVFETMDCTGVAFHFEAYDQDLKTLYHGFRAILCAAPNGVERAFAYSTLHGVMILERTPDDAGVLALSGESDAGNRISVTMVEENGDEMLFAAFARSADEPLKDDDTPRATVKLKRARVSKP